MCGRYALYGPPSRYREYFGTLDWPECADRYNIAPSASVPVVRQAPDGRRVVDLLRWGLVPNWAKDAAIGAKLNNARGETVADKPSFRSAWRRRRCLVPACGYYEWQPIAGDRKQPWFIRLKDDKPMAMGGLWESWGDPATGALIRTFCIITTGPNDVMRPIHDRMPVVVAPEYWSAWLNPAEPDLTGLLVPYPSDQMEAWKVSRRVSNAREEGVELVGRSDEL